MNAAAKNHWLLKSEPESYSIDDLVRDKTTFWSGVRNYQARNFLRDSIIRFAYSHPTRDSVEWIQKGYALNGMR